MNLWNTIPLRTVHGATTTAAITATAACGGTARSRQRDRTGATASENGRTRIRPLVRVRAAAPTRTPVATTHRTGRSARRASIAAAVAARTIGTNNASDTRAVLRTTYGGAMAAIAAAHIPTRRPHSRAAMSQMSATESV